jgi:hypothetical protein
MARIDVLAWAKKVATTVAYPRRHQTDIDIDIVATGCKCLKCKPEK